MFNRWLWMIAVAIVVASASPAAAQTPVLLLAQDSTSAAAPVLRDAADFDWVVTEMPQGLGSANLETLSQYDAVVVWSNSGLDDNAAAVAGNALAAYVDQGGCVVEAVFSQLSTGQDIEGRWRAENYSCIAATNSNVYTAGTLGTIHQQGHPILEGVGNISVGTFRTGDTTLLPGATLVASYNDNQIFISTREDKPGRVVWVGWYPGQPGQLGGDWQLLFNQAVDWCVEQFRANPGGPYVVDEGTRNIDLDASNSRGEIDSYAWDLDNDGDYDDATGATAVFDASALDGPGTATIGLRVTGPGDMEDTATTTITVNNVAPTIVSEPSGLASIGIEYSYTILVDDPGAAFDPPVYTLVAGPEGTAISEQGVLTWTPPVEALDTTVSFAFTLDDGDGGTAQQEWTALVTVPDEDADGVPDETDNCLQVPNPDQLNFDGDEFGDACDPDDDNDGALDDADNCPRIPNGDQGDNDRDGDGDACDPDDDNDFVADVEDNCPLVTNPDQSDEDGNGIGDACDNDLDADGIKDDEDNCPENANLDQADFDRDGQGDACDDDADGDGLSNAREEELGTNHLDPDTDGDGLGDAEEDERGTDPTERDSDDDGVGDGDEVDGGLNPLSPDSDEDGVNDGDEGPLGTDPLNPDSDADGLSDGRELEENTDPVRADSDSGGVNDGDEVARGTNPNDASDDIDTGDPDTGGPGPDTDAGNDGGSSPNTDEACACQTPSQPTGWEALTVLWRRR